MNKKKSMFNGGLSYRRQLRKANDRAKPFICA